MLGRTKMHKNIFKQALILASFLVINGVNVLLVNIIWFANK